MLDLNSVVLEVKNYVVGPVNPYQRTIEARANIYPYFRTREFSVINEFVIGSLNTLLGVSDRYHTAMVTGSGTLGMEIAAMNFTSIEDHVLVISSGSFGDRFAEILIKLDCQVEKIKIDFDTNLLKSDLERLKDPKKYKAVFVNHHETSTGHLHDLTLLRKFCDENGALLVADCMTSFLSDSRKQEMSVCDVIITSSHKGMCCSPGLVFITYKKMEWDRIKRRRCLPSYLDLSVYQKSFANGQTPYTPAVGVVLELADIFELINSIGYDDWVKDIENRAESFRAVVSREWIVPNHRLSNFMTPILLPEHANVTLKTILADLRENHDVEVTPIGGPYRDKMLRVSHVGNHTIKETLKLAEYLNSRVTKYV